MLEEQMKREKEEAEAVLEQQKEEFEQKIKQLQERVMVSLPRYCCYENKTKNVLRTEAGRSDTWCLLPFLEWKAQYWCSRMRL